jgi:hypothetical protein
MFAVRTLLTIAAAVLIWCVMAIITRSFSAGLWSLVSLLAIQMGDLGGICRRGVMEHAVIAKPGIRSHDRIL